MKIYETINDARLVTTIEIGGENRVITFSGGRLSPEWRAAVFQCEEPNIQMALEKSSSYNISYRLRTTVSAVEPKIELHNVEEVFNKQSAIEWLRIKFAVRLAASTSVRQIEQIAAERGYTFLNWSHDE